MEWINKYQTSKPQLISANDKLIKLWKVENRKEKKYESCRKLLQRGKLVMPRSKVVNEGYESKCRSLFKNGHEYHINSICLSPDGEHFLSADDLRVNLWNIEDNTTVYNLLDMKPKKIEELEEVITHCEFHPKNPSLFVYTTTKGFLHVCDIRESSTFQ
jgi:serine/threonine-protein phosphatase 2A regulatory subunit B